AQRIIKHVAVVVDAAHAGTEQKIVASKDLLPETLDSRHFGEEAMTADVKTPPIAQHRAGEATDDIVCLEHGWAEPTFGQLGGGRAPGRPAPDHNNAARVLGGPPREGRSRHRRMKMRSSQTLSPRSPSSIRSRAADVTPMAHRRSNG